MLTAAYFNAHLSDKEKAVDPSDFIPGAARRKAPEKPADMAATRLAQFRALAAAKKR